MANFDFGKYTSEELEEIYAQIPRVIKTRSNNNQKKDWKRVCRYVRGYLKRYGTITIDNEIFLDDGRIDFSTVGEFNIKD